MSELVNLAALTEQAEKLVAAARAAGADAADAVALRSVNQVVSVLNGKVEKVEHAENDEFGLRVFVGDRNAIISATLGADVGELAGRAVAMAKVATADRFAGLADPALLAREGKGFPVHRLSCQAPRRTFRRCPPARRRPG